MSALDTALARVGSELAENLRARLGVWLVLGIVLGYGVLLESDRVRGAYDGYSAATERLARARTLLGGEDWAQRLAGEYETGRALEGAFWEAETEGVAQARLQAALTDMVEGLDLRRPDIRSGVSQAVPDMPGVWQVQMRLGCQYRPGSELQMLYRLATHPKKLVVERLDVRREPSRMTMIVSAYFVGIEPAEAAPE